MSSWASKALLVGFLCQLLLSGCDGERVWPRGDLDELLSRARAESRPVLIYVSQETCPPCRLLEKRLEEDELKALTRGFLLAQVEREAGQPSKVEQRYAVNFSPTLLILEPSGAEIDRLVGYAYTGGSTEKASRQRVIAWLEKHERSRSGDGDEGPA